MVVILMMVVVVVVVVGVRARMTSVAVSSVVAAAPDEKGGGRPQVCAIVSSPARHRRQGHVARGMRMRAMPRKSAASNG